MVSPSSGLVVVRVVFFGDALAAVWAGVVFAEPHGYTLVVEPVGAGKHCNLLPYLDLIHTYRAFGFSIGAEVLDSNLALRQRIDSLGRGWSRRISRGVLFHELWDNSVQRLLGINNVSMDSTGVEEMTEERGEGIERREMSIFWSSVLRIWTKSHGFRAKHGA
jgi:hypothetical protein